MFNAGTQFSETIIIADLMIKIFSIDTPNVVIERKQKAKKPNRNKLAM